MAVKAAAKKTSKAKKPVVKTSPNDWKILSNIPVTELVLDPENIRLPIQNSGQDVIIVDLFSNEDAMEIVRSIHNNGLYHDELPDVILEKGKYIVVDGNRRVSALKAMIEPRLVPSFSKSITDLKVKPIKAINVVLVPNREEAIKHVANKHTNNTRRPWKPLRQAYFYKSLLDKGKKIAELKKDYPEHDIEKFIKMLEVHHIAKSLEFSSPEITGKVHDDRHFPITTLERMYEDKNIRDFIGFDFDKNGKFQVKIVKKEFQKGITRLVEDIATGKIDSRKTNNEKQRLEYIKNFPKESIPNPKKSDKKIGAEDFKPIPTPIKNKNKMFKGLIPPYVKFSLENSSLRTMFMELKTLKVDDFPNASHDLLRSFLECSLVTYFKETGEYSKITKSISHNPKLSELLTYASSTNCTSISDSNVKQVINKIKTNYSEHYSLERLNMINHNENCLSTPKEVRAAWGQMEALMKVILNPVKDGKK